MKIDEVFVLFFRSNFKARSTLTRRPRDGEHHIANGISPMSTPQKTAPTETFQRIACITCDGRLA